MGKYGEKSKGNLEKGENMHINNTTGLFVFAFIVTAAMRGVSKRRIVGHKPVQLLKNGGKGSRRRQTGHFTTRFPNLCGIHFIENSNGCGDSGVSGCRRAVRAELDSFPDSVKSLRGVDGSRNC